MEIIQSEINFKESGDNLRGEIIISEKIINKTRAANLETLLKAQKPIKEAKNSGVIIDLRGWKKQATQINIVGVVWFKIVVAGGGWENASASIGHLQAEEDKINSEDSHHHGDLRVRVLPSIPVQLSFDNSSSRQLRAGQLALDRQPEQ